MRFMIYIFGAVLLIVLIWIGVEIAYVYTIRSGCYGKLLSEGKMTDIYLQRGESYETAEKFKNELLLNAEIESVVLISNEEEFENLRQRHADDRLFIQALEKVGPQSIQHHLIVTFKTLGNLETAKTMLQTLSETSNISIERINQSIYFDEDRIRSISDISLFSGIKRYIDDDASVRYQFTKSCSKAKSNDL